MSNTVKIVLGAVLGLFLLVIVGATIGASTYFSYSNKEIMLRNQIKQKIEANKVVHDKCWKSVQEIGGVADAYADKFEGIYSKIMDARYSKGDGSLMKWVTEANPNFDTRLYDKLANKIEASRAEFADVQTQLLDLKREHDNMLLTFPGSLILSGRDTIHVAIVTSTRTDTAFASGHDNETYKAGSKP